jgi:hypothetical protein
MYGQKHPYVGGQAIVQADQGHLEQIGGGALNHGIDGMTAGFSGIGKQNPSRCLADSGGVINSLALAKTEGRRQPWANAALGDHLPIARQLRKHQRRHGIGGDI